MATDAQGVARCFIALLITTINRTRTQQERATLDGILARKVSWRYGTLGQEKQSGVLTQWLERIANSWLADIL